MTIHYLMDLSIDANVVQKEKKNQPSLIFFILTRRIKMHAPFSSTEKIKGVLYINLFMRISK